MKPKQQPIVLLGKHKAEIQRRFAVSRVGIFGSQVRGEAKPDSDVDVLVEFEQPTFDRYMELKFFLEELFGSPVDLVLADSLKPRLRPIVNREVVYA
jgi:predicted nucleotidyltransferase